MTMTETEPFNQCADYLAQGDIFAIPLVAPYADDEIRIFRTANGLHGYNVFEKGGLEGRVYDYKDLLDVLDDLPDNERVLPFHPSPESPYEMAVVYADLLEFFVMASQTCDVSGVESKPKSFASVLPFIPIASYLSREKLAIDIPEENAKDYSKWTTIVEYLENKVSLRSLKHKNDPFELPNVVTEIIREWNPPKKSKERKIVSSQ